MEFKKEKQSEHYLATVLALIHATRTALFCIPEEYRFAMKRRSNIAMNSLKAFEGQVSNEILGNSQLIKKLEDLSAFYTEILEDCSKVKQKDVLLSNIKLICSKLIEEDIKNEKQLELEL